LTDRFARKLAVALHSVTRRCEVCGGPIRVTQLAYVSRSLVYPDGREARGFWKVVGRRHHDKYICDAVMLAVNDGFLIRTVSWDGEAEG